MSDREQEVAVAVATLRAILDRVEAKAQHWETTGYKVKQVEADSKQIRSELDKVLRTLHFGNGVPPVMQRLSFAELALKDLKDASNAMKLSLKNRKREQTTVWVAIVGSFGLIAKELISLIPLFSGN